ncbi:hypothetical protein ART_4366 [Arthrobacter sp. PAMC 25486]|nr:hypothetical protein ART_0003 [Arthrobacter sp. PAMC 25486]AIY02399.1 hypothetical protein ART_2800 [Arthrobacter sp. PAMC 25486]AIY02403.1 hypothetical protein ART_2804 [Arthrobacter sp. PAMC 25486]AIY02932.1 hypothetical protein ART_3333 [Arthrobacter sp. PAMC 25486]AIY02935.1 hypothetical protein ART_3336 [Arthrobacter sp. PAMC 25486]
MFWWVVFGTLLGPETTTGHRFPSWGSSIVVDFWFPSHN